MVCVRIVGVYIGRVDNVVDEFLFFIWSLLKWMIRNFVGFGIEKVLDCYCDDDYVVNCILIRECFVVFEVCICILVLLEFDVVLLILLVRKL